MATKTIQSRSLDTQKLMDYLDPERITVGQVVSYEELSTVIGRNVQRDAYSNLRTARHRLAKDKQVIYDPVLGIGIKRLSDGEKIKSGLSEIPRIHKHVRRAATKMLSVDNYDGLTPGQQKEHHFGLAHLGGLELMSGSAASKKVREAQDGTAERLTVSQTLALFVK